MGVFNDIRFLNLVNSDASLEKIWSIGEKTCWYYETWLLEIRGFSDQIAGGAGMRRGRKSDTELNTGDALDFWRVLIADKDAKRLL